MAKQALGKGLGALIKKQSPAANALTGKDGEAPQAVQNVDIDLIVPSPLQPRASFNEEQLAELTESIRAHGIIQPLIVRLVNGKHELIAGERRWRASKAVGLKTVPLIVREAEDSEVLEMALIENLQRQDLSPIEEAHGYVRLVKEFTMKQEEIAKRVGKSRASVANAMRLLDLHPDIQQLVAGAKLTVGHAKAILSLKDHDSQLVVSQNILQKGLTVRAAEKLVRQLNMPRIEPDEDDQKNGSSSSRHESSAEIDLIQSTLQRLLATHVTVHHTSAKGKIEIEYYGREDLQRLLELIGVPSDSL